MNAVTAGRIVLYTLSEVDAEQINRRRTDGPSIAERIRNAIWPIGAQAHIGNEAKAGDILPAMVVRTWSESCANLQVWLDGNDVYWATSRNGSDEPTAAHWHWPVRS